MNTWTFSKNGQVTEPLELAAAKKYVVENQDAYAWQSSYTQWLPVHSISEFSALLPARKEVAKLPQNIVDEFNKKEQTLEKRFGQFNQDLARGEETAKLFEQEIANYKRLTINLSDEVKGNINEIEQQYVALHTKLSDLKQVVNTSQQELSTVVKDFNNKISNKTVIKSSANEKPSFSPTPEKNQATAMEKIAAELEQQASAKIAAELEQQNSEKTATEQEPQAKASQDSEPATDVQKPPAKAISTRARRPTSAQVVNTRSGPVHAPTDKAVDSPAEVSKVTSINERVKKDQVANSAAVNAEAGSQATAKAESGVKNIFKSVFNKEESASTTNKFAALVEQDEQNVPAETEAELENIYDDSKKARKRKRR